MKRGLVKQSSLFLLSSTLVQHYKR